MASQAGTTLIHPNVFHDVRDAVGVSGWQLRRDTASALTFLLCDPAGPLQLEASTAQMNTR